IEAAAPDAVDEDGQPEEARSATPARSENRGAADGSGQWGSGRWEAGRMESGQMGNGRWGRRQIGKRSYDGKRHDGKGRTRTGRKSLASPRNFEAAAVIGEDVRSFLKLSASTPRPRPGRSVEIASGHRRLFWTFDFAARWKSRAKFSSGVLTVLVHRCCATWPGIDGRQPSPYVKTYLLPDKTKRSKRRTNARRGTCNPSFGTQPLVSVWHSVALGANLFLGQALVPMEQVRPNLLQAASTGLPVRDRHDQSCPGGVSLPTLMYQGEIAVSIRFEADNKSEESDNNDEARGRLEIWVRSCRKLASAAGGAATLNVSPYVEMASKRKSKVVKAQPEPQNFNAMLTYNGVTRRELRDRSIELTVWDHVLLGRNDFLGGVRLNIGDTARYSWMDAQGHEQTLWTGMLSNPSKWIDASLILRPNMGPKQRTLPSELKFLIGKVSTYLSPLSVP
uniref:C2 domain-containing protein n=1 Tax=Macrostomum lignano TaxID=282301 RepID=A0A1I8F9D6_9PLAT